MGFVESYCVVLRDTYTIEDIQRLRWAFNNLSDYVVIDNRSSLNIAKIPTEVALKALRDKYERNVKPVDDRPGKINIEANK